MKAATARESGARSERPDPLSVDGSKAKQPPASTLQCEAGQQLQSNKIQNVLTRCL